MSIAPFPHHYFVRLTGDALTAAPRPAIRMGAPPQFNGNDDVWSPEHLLVASVLSCLKTTFDAYARREGVAVHHWQGNATGVLAKSSRGPVFASIDLEIEIASDPGEEERLQALIGAAERDCIISRALSAPVHVTAKVTTTPDRATG